MGNIDPKTARQVWQRVNAPPSMEPDRGTLQALALYAAETAALYQALAGALTGKPKEQAQRLWELQRDTFFCLRGLQKLSPSSGNGPRIPKAPNMPAGKLAVQGFRRAKHALTEYTARCIDPEFGPVFHHLAQREEGNCAVTASILGQL